MDHEVCQFSIRVSLVEPSFTKINLDLSAPQTAASIPDNNKELGIASRAVHVGLRSHNKEPEEKNPYQTAGWNGQSGERWVTHQARLDATVAVFGLAAIDTAAPVTGERVMDIGCGAGASQDGASSSDRTASNLVPRCSRRRSRIKAR